MRRVVYLRRIRVLSPFEESLVEQFDQEYERGEFPPIPATSNMAGVWDVSGGVACSRLEALKRRGATRVEVEE